MIFSEKLVSTFPDHALVPLFRRLLVARMQMGIEHDRYQQHDSLDDILGLDIHVHDGHAVQQHADQQRADHYAHHVAAPADKADAAEHNHHDDVEDQRGFGDLEMHQRRLRDHHAAADVSDGSRQRVFEHRQRTGRDARQSGGGGIVAMRVDRAPEYRPRKKQVQENGRRAEDQDWHRHTIPDIAAQFHEVVMALAEIDDIVLDSG